VPSATFYFFAFAMAFGGPRLSILDTHQHNCHVVGWLLLSRPIQIHGLDGSRSYSGMAALLLHRLPHSAWGAEPVGVFAKLTMAAEKVSPRAPLCRANVVNCPRTLLRLPTHFACRTECFKLALLSSHHQNSPPADVISYLLPNTRI
jgi:hypothetical protein